MPADGTGKAIVVLVPGGGWRTADPAGLEPLAHGLASSGYVAATISYRAAGVGVHFPVPLADVLCGAASAVAQAATRGRGGAPVVLVGHSAGGQLSVLAALRPNAFRSQCTDPPVTPGGVVALAGAFDLAGIAQDLFGVPETAGRDRWHDGDVHTWVRERPDLPVLLVHGSADQVVSPGTSTSLATELQAAGHSVRTEVVPAATHDTIYQPAVVLRILRDWLSTTQLAVCPRC